MARHSIDAALVASADGASSPGPPWASGSGSTAPYEWPRCRSAPSPWPTGAGRWTRASAFCTVSASPGPRRGRPCSRRCSCRPRGHDLAGPRVDAEGAHAPVRSGTASWSPSPRGSVSGWPKPRGARSAARPASPAASACCPSWPRGRPTSNGRGPAVPPAAHGRPRLGGRRRGLGLRSRRRRSRGPRTPGAAIRREARPGAPAQPASGDHSARTCPMCRAIASAAAPGSPPRTRSTSRSCSAAA